VRSVDLHDPLAVVFTSYQPRYKFGNEGNMKFLGNLYIQMRKCFYLLTIVKANFSTFGAVFLNYYSPTSRYVNDVKFIYSL
jgi:hypothetical protein